MAGFTGVSAFVLVREIPFTRRLGVMTSYSLGFITPFLILNHCNETRAGCDDPNAGGESLRMWKNYFVNGKIHAIDIINKTPQEQDRINIFKGSQADPEFLANVHKETGDFDIIVDDRSHLNEHIIKSQHTFSQNKGSRRLAWMERQ